jgi:hypothetical protein
MVKSSSQILKDVIGTRTFVIDDAESDALSPSSPRNASWKCPWATPWS